MYESLGHFPTTYKCKVMRKWSNYPCILLVEREASVPVWEMEGPSKIYIINIERFNHDVYNTNTASIYILDALQVTIT